MKSETRIARTALRHPSRLWLATLLSCVALAFPASADDLSGTFSIVAYDPQTQELGVAVQSRAFSVGGGVPWAEAGIGAIATQAQTNESFGPRGLELLRRGVSAAEVLRTLLASDTNPQRRQVGIVDAQGRSAAHTGAGCTSWAGDSTAPNLSVQGNILAGPEVVSEMVRAFDETEGELAERLLAALHAGQAAGGDKRGQQSAALLVVRPSDLYPEYRFRYVDLRVEDHETPIEELERVFRIHQSSDLLRAHARYAALYDSLGDAEAAARERGRVAGPLRYHLKAGTEDAGILNGLAWYCATADLQLEDALIAARRAAELEPKNTAILDTLAEVLFRLGRPKEAVTTIDRALALDPEDAYLRGQRARFQQGNAEKQGK